MEKQHSRRAALGALASVPALAILPVAASSPSTTQLSALIEAHRAARAIFSNATEASEAAEPDPDIRVYYLGRELFAIGHSRRETLIDAEEDAILAICEHRCVSIEEIAIEVRHLAGLWTAYSRRTRAARFLRRFCRKGRKSNRLFDDRTAVGATRRPNRFCRERRNRDRDTRVSPRSGEGQPTINERQRRFRRPEIIAEMDCGMVNRGNSAAGSFGIIATPVFVGAGCRTQRGEH